MGECECGGYAKESIDREKIPDLKEGLISIVVMRAGYSQKKRLKVRVEFSERNRRIQN